MHLTAIPRHRLETTLREYRQVLGAWLRPDRHADAVARFERQFAEYVGSRHAIAVSSGRLGMHLILQELDLPRGCEAIVPAFNLFAVIERFRGLGIVPRFADIDGDTLNLRASSVERATGPNTRVLLVTHMFGHAADMDALADHARRRGLILLEDCAHALGSRCGERLVGTFGRAAIFSFSVLKLATTFGGGVVTTNDDDLAAGIRRRLAQCGATQNRGAGLSRIASSAVLDCGTRRYLFSFGCWPALRLLRGICPDIQQRIMTETPTVAERFRAAAAPPMHAFQAVLGSSQLRRCEEFIARRRQVSAWLDEELAGVPQVAVLRREQHGRHNGLYYGILAEHAAELSAHLFRRGIDSETSEYRNCADLALYRDYHADCPAARDVGDRILRLPNFGALTRSDVRRVAMAIRGFYAHRADAAQLWAPETRSAAGRVEPA